MQVPGANFQTPKTKIILTHINFFHLILRHWIAALNSI